jgi:hypothetical protein
MSHFTRISLIACLMLFGQASTVLPVLADGVMQRLGRVEQCLYGSEHREQPLQQRLQAVEASVLGKTQSGSANARLEAVERIVGKIPSVYLPPVAPTLDTGAREVSNAPSESNSARAANSTADKSGHAISTRAGGGSATHAQHTPVSANAAGHSGAVNAVAGSNLAEPLASVANSTASGEHTTGEPPIAPSIGETLSKQGAADGGHSPYVTKDGESTVLHANATEFGAAPAPFQNPLAPYAVPAPPLQGNASAQNQAPLSAQARHPRLAAGAAVGGVIVGTAARAALTTALHGGGGAALFSNVARAGVGSTFSQATRGSMTGSGAAQMLQVLHCPICRLIHF